MPNLFALKFVPLCQIRVVGMTWYKTAPTHNTVTFTARAKNKGRAIK